MAILLLVTAFFIVLLFSCLIYNRCFHRLARFPGPVLGGLTDVYHTYLFATKKYHEKLIELHQQYGPIVRVCPNLLSFSDATMLPAVYHRNAEKTPFYSTGLAGEVAPLLQIQGHREHAAKLKSLSATVRRRLLVDTAMY